MCLGICGWLCTIIKYIKITAYLVKSYVNKNKVIIRNSFFIKEIGLVKLKVSYSVFHVSEGMGSKQNK